jgi:sugar phosphate isomerase/epimerase
MKYKASAFLGLFLILTIAVSGMSPAKKTKPFIGIQLWSVRNDVKEDLPGTFAKLGEYGYKFIEAANYVDGKFYGMTPGEIKKVLNSNGLEFLSSHVGTTLPAEGKWEESMKWWDTAIAAHKEVGASYIVIPSLGKSGYESLAELKKYCDYYNAIGEKCNKAGIRFGYHNHSKEFAVLEGEVMYDYMLKNTDPAKVMFQLDLYWIVESGNDPLDYFAKYPGRFELWHVKDKTEIGCPDCKMDFTSIFKKAKQSGMKHYIVEVERYNYTPMESVKRSIDYLLTQKYVK